MDSDSRARHAPFHNKIQIKFVRPDRPASPTGPFLSVQAKLDELWSGDLKKLFAREEKIQLNRMLRTLLVQIELLQQRVKGYKAKIRQIQKFVDYLERGKLQAQENAAMQRRRAEQQALSLINLKAKNQILAVGDGKMRRHLAWLLGWLDQSREEEWYKNILSEHKVSKQEISSCRKQISRAKKAVVTNKAGTQTCKQQQQQQPDQPLGQIQNQLMAAEAELKWEFDFFLEQGLGRTARVRARLSALIAKFKSSRQSLEDQLRQKEELVQRQSEIISGLQNRQAKTERDLSETDQEQEQKQGKAEARKYRSSMKKIKTYYVNKLSNLTEQIEATQNQFQQFSKSVIGAVKEKECFKNKLEQIALELEEVDSVDELKRLREGITEFVRKNSESKSYVE